jgi:hypothetical protein
VTTIYGVSRVAGVSIADAAGCRGAAGGVRAGPRGYPQPDHRPAADDGQPADPRAQPPRDAPPGARIASPGLAPRTKLLPTEIVIRTSCGCPATGGLERAAQSGPPNRKEKPAWDST